MRTGGSEGGFAGLLDSEVSLQTFREGVQPVWWLVDTFDIQLSSQSHCTADSAMLHCSHWTIIVSLLVVLEYLIVP
jgi:hypothetical protein